MALTRTPSPIVATATGRRSPNGRVRMAPRQPRRWLAFRLALAAVLALLVLVGGALPRELRIRQAAQPHAFHLVDWHLVRLGERAGRIGAELLGLRGSVDADARAAAAAYFAARPADRAALRPAAEDAIERAVTAALADAGLGVGLPIAGGPVVFPPVSFTFVSPPSVLVVSPRDRIRTVQAELLAPGTTEREAELLERAVDGHDVASLVVPTGGLATYPAMVLQGTRPRDALDAVAHEWVHGYLIFTPLGLRYWSSEDARAINETAADLVGRELAPGIARRLGIEIDAAPPRPDGGRAGDRDVRSILRATRIDVDRLLAEGRVEEAEALMRARREELAGLGYAVRKLNQAYFAFYGSYGDAAAGASPIPGQLRRLRESSASVADFLRRVGRLASAEDLARAVGDPPPAR
jgi:hypothetical protein